MKILYNIKCEYLTGRLTDIIIMLAEIKEGYHKIGYDVCMEQDPESPQDYIIIRKEIG